MKIKKGDLVKIIAGAKGKKGLVGRIAEVDRETLRVQVEGLPTHKRHLKPQAHPKHPEGGIVELPSSVHVSNVMLMSESQSRPVRTGVVINDSGKKQRVARGRQIKAEVL